jgi:hypothetical protein
MNNIKHKKPYFNLFYCLLFMLIPNSGIFSQPFQIINTTARSGETGSTIQSSRILGLVTNIAQLSKYGGWKLVNVGGIGFFRTEKMNNAWYLVDPEGYLFISMGPNSVKTSYNIPVPGDLWFYGNNTLGNWSEWEEINRNTEYKMPYCPRWNFLQSYKNISQRGKNLYDAGIIPIFDPAFEPFCDQFAQQIQAIKDDPYCLGIFSDNELPIYDNDTYGKLLDRFLGLPHDDPNYVAADQWMISRKGSGYMIGNSDREEFHGYVVGTYYRIVNNAIKKYDPNHLYFGSRLHGDAKYKSSIFREAGKYVDVISINYYSRWNPEQYAMQMWLEQSGKPFLITEFYAKAYDVGLSNSTGAGYKVPTQKDRAIYFENSAIGLLENRGCVGWHWHRYDDSETTNHGFINKDSQWYLELMDSFFKIARDVYHLRNFLLSVSKSAGATFYPYPDFDGYAVSLSPGNYIKTQLEANQILDDEISSLKIMEGYKVIVFNDDNFSGDSLVINSDLYNFSDVGFDNNISSLKIVPASSALNFRSQSIPTEFVLHQNYPNPFNPTTTITYEVNARSLVKIDIYDQLGKKIQSFMHEVVAPSEGKFVWDGCDNFGNEVASGLYFAQLTVNNQTKMIKMLLIR